MTIFVVIVVYNKDIENSSVCMRLREKENIKVLVVDNSDIENHNEEYCRQNKIDYLSMGGNKGLSKAYNTAVDYCHNADAIILLDDDTDVPDEYFSKLGQALVDHSDTDIFAPIIKGQNGVIYSPNNYCFLKNQILSSPLQQIKQERFNAISSCLAIRTRVFENYRYNEKLFVDEVDHCFCREQRDRHRKFEIIDVVINQNFHQREAKVVPEKAWKREKIRITDIFRHARLMGRKIYIILAFVKGCGLGLQIGKISRSPIVAVKAIGLSCMLVFFDR